nr:Chain Bg, mL99 [Trypanosoma brucei]
GRFNMDEAAAALQLNPAYAAALYRPLNYTFHIRGQLYPAQKGRPSRPGSLAASQGRMFPLYQRNDRLDKELFRLNSRGLTTE